MNPTPRQPIIQLANPSSNTPPAESRVRARDLFVERVEWGELIRGQGPVEVEIGSGKGLFLLAAASERPTHQFVGIEMAAKFANSTAERLAKSGLHNVHMLRGDARKFMTEVVPVASLQAVHVYFPDPWWRNRHKKRRVLNDETLLAIERSLLPGGLLHFWTDVLDYYEHICGQVMDHTALLGPRYVPQRPAEHAMDYTTHFERRARRYGQPVYRAVFAQPS